jgi:hypothetical protein
MGGDFGFWDLSIQCAARHMDISAFVPLQDLGFGRRAARLAVQRVFRNEEELAPTIFSMVYDGWNHFGISQSESHRPGPERIQQWLKGGTALRSLSVRPGTSRIFPPNIQGGSETSAR